jgi:hypothetical protein
VIDLVYSDREAAIYHCDIGRLQQASGAPSAAKTSFQRCADLTSDEQVRRQAEQWLQAISHE